MNILYTTQHITKEDLIEMKELGFDTIINYNSLSKDELDLIDQYGMKSICSDKIEHNCIIAYYIFDEPDLNKISIEDQEKKIKEYREWTDKPLTIACIEATERNCSINFDWYLLDIYYNTKTLSKITNYLNAAYSSQFIKILYDGKKVIPIMGLYDDNDLYGFTEEILPFAKFFRSMFSPEDRAVFLWSYKNSFNGIKDREVYKTWAKELNSYDNVSIFNPILYAVSKLFLKINPMLGKYKITI